jgi:hypothetical protein
MRNTNSHLIGLGVVLGPDVKEELGLDWNEGEIFATLETDRGVAVHVVNPGTGQVTGALLLESMRLTSKGLSTFQNVRDTLLGKR